MFQRVKQSNYRAEKEAAFLNSSRIRQQSLTELENKKDNKLKIKDYEQQSRRNYQIFLLQKQNSIRNYRETEHSRLVESKEKRELQMRDLARMELQMIERQSKSREAADVSNQALRKMVSKPRLPKKTSIDRYQGPVYS